MTRVVISPRAEGEIEDIWLMIAADGVSIANRIVSDIGRRIDRLKDHPRLGPRRPDIAPIVRVLVEGHFLIVYEHHPNTDEGPVELVYIVSVVDSRQDLTRLF